MINGKKVVAIIPARGGSKGIPYKNIKLLAGKPLLAWTVEQGRNTSDIDYVFVSTDDEKIAEVAYQYQAEVIMRSPEYAQDHTLMKDTVRDAIKKLIDNKLIGTDDYVVLLQPTSPLRISDDITKCLDLLKQGEYDSVSTFSEAELNPHRAWRIVDGSTPEVFIEGAIPWLQRQQLPDAYQLNGAVYAFKIGVFLEDHSPSFLVGRNGAVIMPKDRSADIDDEMDWMIVEHLIQRNS